MREGEHQPVARGSSARAAMRTHGTEQHGKHDRAEHGELGGDEFQSLERIERDAAALDVVAGVPEGGEAVLDVPEDIRRDHDGGDRAARATAPGPQQRARVRRRAQAASATPSTK